MREERGIYRTPNFFSQNTPPFSPFLAVEGVKTVKPPQLAVSSHFQRIETAKYGPCQARPVAPSSSTFSASRLADSVTRSVARIARLLFRCRHPTFSSPSSPYPASSSTAPPPRSHPAHPPSRGTQPLPSSSPSSTSSSMPLDERLPRGGEQKSVVVLSPLLLHLPAPLLRHRQHRPRRLDLVASHVAAWPLPTLGSPMDLPIGGAALRVHPPPPRTTSSPPPSPPGGPCSKSGREPCRARPYIKRAMPWHSPFTNRPYQA